MDLYITTHSTSFLSRYLIYVIRDAKVSRDGEICQVYYLPTPLVLLYPESVFPSNPLYPDDEKHTSFRTPLGVYCYTVMPFGLKNAGATYQRAMKPFSISKYAKRWNVMLTTSR